MSSSANSVPSAGQSQVSNSAVCEHIGWKLSFCAVLWTLYITVYGSWVNFTSYLKQICIFFLILQAQRNYSLVNCQIQPLLLSTVSFWLTGLIFQSYFSLGWFPKAEEPWRSLQQVGCHSCCPTTSVKVLKEEVNQLPLHILISVVSDICKRMKSVHLLWLFSKQQVFHDSNNFIHCSALLICQNLKH